MDPSNKLKKAHQSPGNRAGGLSNQTYSDSTYLRCERSGLDVAVPHIVRHDDFIRRAKGLGE